MSDICFVSWSVGAFPWLDHKFKLSKELNFMVNILQYFNYFFYTSGSQQLFSDTYRCNGDTF